MFGDARQVLFDQRQRKRRVLKRAAHLEDEDWMPVGDHDEVALIRYRPYRWFSEPTYAVVHRELLKAR